MPIAPSPAASTSSARTRSASAREPSPPRAARTRHRLARRPRRRLPRSERLGVEHVEGGRRHPAADDTQQRGAPFGVPDVEHRHRQHALRRRAGACSHGRGDDSERPFRADQQPLQGRSRRRPFGSAADGHELAGWQGRLEARSPSRRRRRT
jgi:hypothetical protein